MKQINDRFSFDKLFRKLLKKIFSHSDAIEYIINNFSLSPLVFQERIENKYYLKIYKGDRISKDLKDYKDKVIRKILLDKLTKTIN